MKAFFLFALIAIVVFFAWRQYTQHDATLAQKATGVSDAAAAKARVVGERIEDARVVAVIKGKYVVDKELSALAITVDCSDGRVTLTGVVDSPAILKRAVEMARATSGVREVNSQLKLRN